MRHIFKYSLWILAILFVSVSCSDDLSDNNSTIETTENGRTTRFFLEHMWEGITTINSIIDVELYQSDGLSIHRFEGEAKLVDKMTEILIHIPNGHQIAEGRYTMVGFIDGEMLPTRLLLSFKNELVSCSRICEVNYTDEFKKGSGTESDPFEIGSNADFNTLCKLLREDTQSHAAGLYFSQTADFSLDFQGSTIDDYGHSNQAFAGTYMGNNHSISNLVHTGSAQAGYDENIGLFKELHNGAVISDLTISLGSCTGILKNFGAVAAQAENATIVMKNITVKGSVYGNEDTSSQAGGLIGSIKNCDLTVSYYYPGVTILNFNKHVGGVVGYAESSDIKVSKVYNSVGPDERLAFRFVGGKYVGGLIGEAYQCSMDISSVTMKYTTSTGNSNMLISASQGSVGGVAGQITDPRGDCVISNVSIYCPIGYIANDGSYKGESVGGLVGYLKTEKGFKVTNCVVCGKVVGDKNVGGLAGYLKAGSGGLLIDGEYFELPASEEIGIGIFGNENVGGLFGHADHSKISGCDKFITSANVIANRVSAGGMVGLLSSTVLNVGSKSFVDDILKVSGNQYVGGLVGSMLDNSTITGDNSYAAFSSGGEIRIPSKKDMKRNFSGKVEGNMSVGGVVGYLNNGHLENLHVNASVIGNGNNVGGVVGELVFSSDSTNFVRQCSFEGIVKNPDADRTGGIAGSVDCNGTIIDCINYGDINSADRGKHSGGIVGYMEYSDYSPAIRYCVNVGPVGGDYTAGGIVAHITGSASHWVYVLNCANYGHITCSSSTSDTEAWWGVGGIVGSCDHKRVQVGYCANHGSVDGLSNSYFHGVGGIAGVLGEDPIGTEVPDNMKIYSCANYGNVSHGGSGDNIGGIIGYQEEGDPGDSDYSSSVVDCINHGTISDGGGICGEVDHYSHIERCVNMGQMISGDALIGDKKTGAKIHDHNLYYRSDRGTSSRGSGFTSGEQASQSTFKNFDFNITWRLDPGDSYPTLRKCTFESVSQL